MDIAAARNAAPVVAEIDALNEKIALLQQAKAGNWQVTSMMMLDPDSHQQSSVIMGQLDVQTSGQCFDFALSIYQSMLTAAQAQLAAL